MRALRNMTFVLFCLVVLTARPPAGAALRDSCSAYAASSSFICNMPGCDCPTIGDGFTAECGPNYQGNFVTDMHDSCYAYCGLCFCGVLDVNTADGICTCHDLLDGGGC